MLEGSCNNTNHASGQKKRKRRGLLFSSRRALDRSRMRSSKHVSRLTTVEKTVGLRIDFGGEEVTNLASLQEADAARAQDHTTGEDNATLYEGTDTRPIVRVQLLI